MVLEIFDYDVDKMALVGPCATAGSVARALKSDFPDFGVLHDLSHIYLCHEEPAKHLPLIRNHLVAMHLGSSVSDRSHPLFGDTHPLFGMPGGDSDVPQLRDFVRVLFDIGYLRPAQRQHDAPQRSARPVCSFEIKPPEGVTPQTAIANMKRTWQRAWWAAFGRGPAMILTGPEGGFTPDEAAAIRAAPNSTAISLGPRILRAETAALAAIAAWMAAAGDWR